MHQREKAISESPNLSVPSLWEECIEGSTALRGCFEFIIVSASNGGKGCLVKLQETEVFTPTGCPKFVLMSCEVGDWSDWTIQEETQFSRTRSSSLKATGPHCELCAIS